MASWRTMWQKWKKDNPDFDKLRVKTIDLGPLMDDTQHEIAALVRDVQNLDKDMRELQQIKQRLDAGLKQYLADVKAHLNAQHAPDPEDSASERAAKQTALRAAQAQFTAEWKTMIATINDGLFKAQPLPKLNLKV